MAKRKRRIPPRVWYGQDKLRAAYYAGQGKSAEEIALIVGGTDASRVRSMLYAHGIPLMRKAGSDDVLQLRWKRTDRDNLEKAAEALDRDAADLAALIIRKVLTSNPELLEGLIHEFDVV